MRTFSFPSIGFSLSTYSLTSTLPRHAIAHSESLDALDAPSFRCHLQLIAPPPSKDQLRLAARAAAHSVWRAAGASVRMLRAPLFRCITLSSYHKRQGLTPRFCPVRVALERAVAHAESVALQESDVHA